MKKLFKRGIKFLGCFMLAMAITIIGEILPIPGAKDAGAIVAKAATVSNRVPLWCYMKSGSGKTYTYTTSSLNSSTGYIEPGDYCKILNFYSNGAVRVQYPTSRGYRIAYASAGGFLENVNFSNSIRTLGVGLTAYRRSTGVETIGTVYATDQVNIIGNANGRTQLIYPCNGGYKVGWVNGNYSIGSNPIACIDAVSSPSEGKLRVAGWIFDPDALGTSAQVHVYVGGVAGSGAPGWAITCNSYRPDVNNCYHCGDNHGFDVTFSPGKSGDQTIYFYAINIGGGENVYLGNWNVNLGGNNNNSDFSALESKYPSGSIWKGNYRNKAWQCHGFALTLGYERTGTDPYGWSKVYNLNSLKPGDIIVCNRPHTIMVTAVSGNIITYVDCNWVGKNKVMWNQTIQRGRITTKFKSLKYVLVSPK
jgi:hypothetical protein